jgi:SSS family solute:Na+ symporter
MVTHVSGDVMSALVIACGLAALMSTMDSQLLTLSSIFTRDIVPLAARKPVKGHALGRLFVVFLSLAGLVLAYRPPATILQIATQTFTGLAVLFPTVVFGLYLKRARPLPAILSILCGEGMMLLYYFHAIPTGGFLPVIPVMIVTFCTYLLAHGLILWRESALRLRVPGWMRDPYVGVSLAIFLLSLDFWAWGKVDPHWSGIPFWLGYFVTLSAAQTFVMVHLVERRQGEIP